MHADRRVGIRLRPDPYHPPGSRFARQQVQATCDGGISWRYVGLIPEDCGKFLGSSATWPLTDLERQRLTECLSQYTRRGECVFPAQPPADVQAYLKDID